MNEEATQILFTVIISLAVVITIVVAIMFCGWCFGKKNDDEDDDESDAEIKKLSQKYSSVPTAEQEAIDVRQLNKRASRTPQTQGADNPMFVR
ncbi:hypothetical protein KUTeg_006650 [Tegillarca granosa]|uniref:Uncharacterized protein n=1 Tax=Tegillarca granosa TaxID=220873 RepID=A0ABQ9FDY3_TEGGR|nr:hypothetical protein KUTeg_006650 [Tegillarca granosa]